MLKMLDPLREINFYSVAFRMILACICGGIIGIEREYRSEEHTSELQYQPQSRMPSSA